MDSLRSLKPHCSRDSHVMDLRACHATWWWLAMYFNFSCLFSSFFFSSAETPHFTLKSINTSSVVLELDNNETATFQVIIQKIDHESNSSQKFQLLANLSGVKNISDIPRIYITAELTGNTVIIGDGKSYGGFNNIPLDAGTDYRVYIRVVRKDYSNGNKVYSEPRDVKFLTKQIEAKTPTPTRKPNVEAGEKPPGVRRKLWLIVAVFFAVIVLAVIIITILCLTRVRKKAQERREMKKRDEKNMYMTINDTNIELKKLDGSLKKNSKENDKREERTYATLGEATKPPSSKVEERAYASLDEATRISREPSAPKAPTGVYESLNNLQTQSTTGQYESLDEVMSKAGALSSVLKSI